jgi:DNA repair protein RecO (recombination protein O)
MLEKTQGIVLHTVPYGETSMVVHIFTRQQGRLSFMVNGVRKSKPRFSISLFRPLNIVDLIIYRKHTSALKRFKEIHQAFPVNNTENPAKTSIAIFVSEILYRSLQDSDPHPDLFDFTVQSLRYFDLMLQGYHTFHHFYMLRLMRYLGFYPDAKSYNDGFVFNLSTGRYQPPDETALHCTSSETAKFIYMLQQSDIENFDMVLMTPAQRNAVLRTLAGYFSHHLPQPVQIRSLDVLHEVFGG